MRREEPEPLAFRVRPLPEECFDSWLDRVVGRHETTRKALFQHLDLEPRLADMDLASRTVGDSARRSALVERLAWATSASTRAIEASFVGCRREHLLPRALRHIGCAQCWFEWSEQDVPLRFERSWILRAAVRCERHDLLLSDLRAASAASSPKRMRILLEGTVNDVREQMTRVDFVKTRLAWNQLVIRSQLRGSQFIPSACSQRYETSLIGNRFHCTSNRHTLLAALHSRDRQEVARFEQLFCAPVPARRGGGQRINRGKVPDLPVLVAAIGAVCRRHLAEPSGTAVHRRARDGGCRIPMVRARERLENLSMRLARAMETDAARQRFKALERRRDAKFGAMRRRLHAEVEAARHGPLAGLQGLQKALFLLKDSGWADDDGGPGTGRSANWDSWDDCLEDAAVLRWRLAARFAHPGLRYLLGSAVSV